MEQIKKIKDTRVAVPIIKSPVFELLIKDLPLFEGLNVND